MVEKLKIPIVIIVTILDSIRKIDVSYKSYNISQITDKYHGSKARVGTQYIRQYTIFVYI